ncbi:MAG TPA: citramalate synthase, partial [Thermodesulfobacteriota bacterium]|nr:citramalate synthase [Thermodesulfobacteriota bacterium]
MAPRIDLYDTTLRDGTQGEDIAFSVHDKIRIAHRLDELGIRYIEGGWPGSNPRDIDFFDAVKRERFVQARIAAFGSTRRARLSAEDDPNLQALLRAETPVVTIFGKSWDLHVREALRISLEENLELIHDSVRFLKSRVDEVVYDAEHFFDGYAANPAYALQTLEAAADAGADVLVLCDTNGGSLVSRVAAVTAEVVRRFARPIGIHTHNDAELAVANALAAVEAGARHVQGTINGFGERCGNANLISIIPNLQLKMGYEVVTPEQLARLREVSRFVYELANIVPLKRQPYVGDSAFAHKGGVHVSAVQRNARTYEHIEPERVGNRTRVLVSDLSGKSTILAKAAELGLDLSDTDPVVQRVLERIKTLEHRGYQFEGAEGSFELLMKRALGRHGPAFELLGFRVIAEKRAPGEPTLAEATVMVNVDGQVEHTAAVGEGPVNALDRALRKALERFYPELREVRLLDYKVRILNSQAGTAAVTRVLIESGDHEDKWSTVGVSENIIEASWEALTDAIEYKIAKEAA